MHVRVLHTKERSADSLLKMSLYAYFQKASKSCPPNPQGPLSKQLPFSCIESDNNHIEEVANTTCKNCGQSVLSTWAPRGNHEKCSDHETFITKIYIHATFSNSRNFEPRKFGAIATVFVHVHIFVCVSV